MWKRVGLALLAVTFVAGGLAFWRVARAGEGDIESWVGDELKDLVNARGKLTLAFDSVDYRYPDRLILTNLRLGRPTAGAAAKPIFVVRSATVELDELPRRGRPIVLRTVALDGPTLHVDALLARDKPNDATTRPVLSRVVKLRSVTVRDGRIDYDDGTGSPLTWRDLDADLAIDPLRGRAHRVTLAIDQLPLMSVRLAGEIDLDATSISGVKASAKLDLGERSASRFFTPALQRFLTAREVRGTFTLELSGDASLRDFSKNAMTATASLLGGHMTAGQYRFPLDRLDLQASLRGERASIDALRIDALGGIGQGDATLVLDGRRQITGGISVTNLHLDRLVRDHGTGERRRLAGVLGGEAALHTTASMLKLFRTPEGDGVVWGHGSLAIRDARLVDLPVIGELIATTRRLAEPRGDAYRDRLDARFQFVGKRFDCSELTYVGDLIAARGTGDIAFDGGIDLALNAGPLENVQQRLGPIGELWGKLTDEVMTYRVTGTLKKPEVRAVLGK